MPRTKTRKKVQVWLFQRTPSQDLQVLLLKTNPKRGAFWQPVTGSVDSGESFEQAALREAEEETGCQGPRKKDLLPLGEPFAFESKFGPALEQPFALEWPVGSDVRLDGKEHTEFKWLDASRARGLLKYASNAAVLDLLVGRLMK